MGFTAFYITAPCYRTYFLNVVSLTMNSKTEFSQHIDVRRTISICIREITGSSTGPLPATYTSSEHFLSLSKVMHSQRT
jgi:hypothetical protein